MTKYVIRLNSKKLTGFASGDLPSNGKMFESKKYKDSHMFLCYGDGYINFSTEEEAQERIDYIKSQIERNKERYESYLKGSYSKLLKKADKLKVEIDDGIF